MAMWLGVEKQPALGAKQIPKNDALNPFSGSKESIVTLMKIELQECTSMKCVYVSERMRE